MSQPPPHDALAAEIGRSWNLIRGRMLGFIESLGLRREQEAGAKSTFKALASDAQDRIEALIEAPLPRSISQVETQLEELRRLVREISSSPTRNSRSVVSQRITELESRLEQLRDLARINAELEAGR